ncbi:recombinase [bacterium]|nr:recombinase [bacterium]
MSQKAVIYCRVSSKKQVIEGHGLDSQDFRCREYAKSKGYEVAAIFTDDVTGEGDFMKRPGMVKLLRFLDDNMPEKYVVIFDDLKRYARDTIFHLSLRNAMKLRNATRECLNFNFEDTPEGEFVETVFAAQSQLERQQNSRQVSQKMKARMQKGYYCFNPPPGYRYRKHANHGKILTREEPCASVIVEALEGFACGRFETQSEIKRFLESSPHYPKDKNGQVHYTRIRTLLGNKLLAGYIDMPEWGIRHLKGQHEPLISYETYQKVQQRLNGQAKAPARPDIRQDFPLRGFLLCGHCGKPFSSCWSTGRNGKYPYYLCHSRECTMYGKSVRKEKVEEEFEALLADLKPSPPLFFVASQMFTDLWNEQREALKLDGDTIRKEILMIERKTEQFFNRIVETDSPILITSYENQIRKLEEEKIRLNENIALCGRPLQSFDETFRTAFTFLSDPQKLWHSDQLEHQRAVLKLAFDDRLSYCRNEGFRTAAIALPFSLLAQFNVNKSGMVGDNGLEPSTSTV